MHAMSTDNIIGINLQLTSGATFYIPQLLSEDVQKIFWWSLKLNLTSKITFFMNFWCFELPLEFIQGILVSGRQVKKSHEGHVSARINCKTRRKTMPLLSTYYPDPKEHVRYSVHVEMTSTSHSTGFKCIFQFSPKPIFSIGFPKGVYKPPEMQM